ncbi:MAG: hypothetical protein J2P17_14830, partial [Mycobacterium sp.]|nr:hypothetical protein [Mycobacterium sp.]
MTRTAARVLLAAGAAIALTVPVSSSTSVAASPGNGPLARSTELSTTTRLSDRREVAAGTRAYSI